MLTYEDLLAAGKDERERIEFVLKAIGEHKRSKEFIAAKDAQAYYDGENPTIMKYEKIIYDMTGQAHRDLWSANHKIASSFFTFVVDQEVSYLLGNGVRFTANRTKEQLGENFDENMMDALEFARIHGTSFVFWNMDHTDVFQLTEFKPLYGEENGALMAGIRFWQLETNKPLRATLYEPDGFTELIQRNGEQMTVMEQKRAYKQTVKSNDAEGTTITDGTNYDGFPIVPLYSNKKHTSAIRGKRNTIDALDLATSNMINNVDEGNLIYWVLTNCGGMNEDDDAAFIEQLKITRVVHADGDSGATAEPHSVEAPFEGTKVTLDELNDRLYDDFQAFDAKSLTAADMSATAISAGYTRLDMKCDKLERQVTRCINAILKLAGIKDKPAYTRNRVINRTEETQRIVMQADYLDDDYIRKALLTVNGDLDQYEEITKRMEVENADRMKEAERRLREQEENAGRQEEVTDNE